MSSLKSLWQCLLLLLLPGLAAAQSVVLQLQVLEGEGARHAAGARTAKFLTVKVTDDLGRPVPGARVSFRLPESGPGGIFENGLSTEVVTTAADGTATAPAVRWNRVPGAFEVRVVAATPVSRAGTVVPMSLSEHGIAVAARAGTQAAAPAAVRPKRRFGWFVAGLAAGGAAAVGISRGWLGGPR
jgi:hypothetical protein